jgi:hypothetical protein
MSSLWEWIVVAFGIAATIIAIIALDSDIR